MSKNNNVNPGQYKVAGRERPGEDVVSSVHKAKLTQAQAAKGPAPRKVAASKGTRNTAS
jgi:hypothetical protein